MLNTRKCMKSILQTSKNLFFAARTIQMMQNFFLTFKARKLTKYSLVLV
ncbi:Uncharacterised protein [Mycobacteroides abscessus]|nr:Uncharacterised protein [Mycobacteroides abscessus]